MNLVQNHQKLDTKPTIISPTITLPAITKSTKKRRQRAGMISVCTYCLSSNHSRRSSSTTLDNITTTPAVTSSTNPPLLIRLRRIILGRRINDGDNSSNSTIDNTKSR